MLDEIRIASPCPASWGRMQGDHRVRHCADCNLNVYNLSSMPRREAEDLIRKTEGRLCIRLYRRKDGTVVTQDCPAGVRSVRERLVTLACTVWGIVALLLVGSLVQSKVRPDVLKPLGKALTGLFEEREETFVTSGIRCMPPPPSDP